ncbi:hypothetical protein BDR05DRAFT_1011614 [Suillus weaverae]|nr:hypothetical protein BDR05DRAFT_1011614 [Suillus weaverae]
MSGVAYTGGVASGAVYIREVLLPLKDPQQHVIAPERTSPPCHTLLARRANTSRISRSRFNLMEVGSPPLTALKAVTADNARVTPPAVSKLSSNTPPLQAMKTRTPDKSLPV